MWLKSEHWNIEKSRQYCLNENIYHSLFIKRDKLHELVLIFVANWHCHLALIKIVQGHVQEIHDAKNIVNFKYLNLPKQGNQ